MKVGDEKRSGCGEGVVGKMKGRAGDKMGRNV